MAIYSFEDKSVAKINALLDQVGLNVFVDRLVVVGGAAMAAFGIKKVMGIDIDIVISDELAKHLEQTGRWRKADEVGESWEETRHFVPTAHAGIDAIRMPLDEIYPLSSQELIAAGQEDPITGYRFATPPGVLDMKLALVMSEEYLKVKSEHTKHRHMKYIHKLTQYLLKVAV